ncbi:glycosyltransferase family 1 protein [Bradyrhizobium sp. OK095]|uniref:glycosyltransferase family 4 protein n=1 Tax=Bradyrhizobium sp. OK095 TaxID=1882760 RepID=UPI0008D77B05|nr:glycosyltransferase family 1 protein [Bradyrhizobium sp. OK095]SEN77029.1 alpha-1,3-rhamnosyl/mannosyltransferase [Bradyrhizobium sp. OK095]
MRVILAVDAIRQPLTGVGRYTFELARQLAAFPEFELTFLHGRKLVETIPIPAAGHPLLPVVRDVLSNFSLPTAVYRRYQGYVKARTLRHERDAILHGANYYLPAFPGRSIVTIHDVSIFTAPEQHRRDRVRYMRKEVALSLQHAGLIITVSDFSKREIMRVLGVGADRIKVTPLGVGSDFRPRAVDETRSVLAGLGLQPDGYCLYVGTIEPRKNLATLLDAFERLPAPLRRRYPLVLAGYRGWESEDLHARIDKAAREGWLTYLGYVPEHQLQKLLSGARLFIFPSLYEGFGLPPLEAMASGIPVVCSGAAALRETVGDAAVTVAPRDAGALAEAIAMAVDDEGWREQARRRGFARAAIFSWERCARMTAAIYKELAAQ